VNPSDALGERASLARRVPLSVAEETTQQFLLDRYGDPDHLDRWSVRVDRVWPNTLTPEGTPEPVLVYHVRALVEYRSWGTWHTAWEGQVIVDANTGEILGWERGRRLTDHFH